ncbi:hypothetical protein FVE85_1640 [Porphyridium purpureum]|uniref:Uncharacterized protein n=1 Tax=Porphyridium purpureum TaxID=35688 RepID=A0A5J4YW78_PORPP|nr:hypothetical protein FVE85_1640 [Porphyridium purpureum]|eukprot:POR2385..scf209_3
MGLRVWCVFLSLSLPIVSAALASPLSDELVSTWLMKKFEVRASHDLVRGRGWDDYKCAQLEWPGERRSALICRVLEKIPEGVNVERIPVGDGGCSEIPELVVRLMALQELSQIMEQQNASSSQTVPVQLVKLPWRLLRKSARTSSKEDMKLLEAQLAATVGPGISIGQNVNLTFWSFMFPAGVRMSSLVPQHTSLQPYLWASREKNVQAQSDQRKLIWLDQLVLDYFGSCLRPNNAYYERESDIGYAPFAALGIGFCSLGNDADAVALDDLLIQITRAGVFRLQTMRTLHRLERLLDASLVLEVLRAQYQDQNERAPLPENASSIIADFVQEIYGKASELRRQVGELIARSVVQTVPAL